MASDGKIKPPFNLTSDPQATQLTLSVAPGGTPLELLIKDVRQSVQALKLSVAVDENALVETCRAAAQGQAAKQVVANGTPPVHGVDGKLLWSKSIAGLSEESRQASHYLGRLEKKIVKKGDALAKVAAETPGTDGKNIYGKTLKATRGKALKTRPGANVREEGGIFYAEKDGLVRVTNGKVQIDEIFVVEGSLSFEVGNIDFPGSVVVRGGVLDLFEIKAGGAVQIEGLVEAAMISAGGDIEIKGGIEGKKKGIVKSKGSVSAKFLVNANVYAEGNVSVETEIITSKVMSLGMVKAPGGAIAGGEVVALGGVDAQTIGSESATRTTVVAGVNYALPGQVKALDKEIAEARSKLAAIDRQLTGRDTTKLGPKEKDRMTALNLEKEPAERSVSEAENRRSALLEQDHRAARPVVLVREAIHPGVEIRLASCSTTISETIRGPVKLIPDMKNRVVRFVATSV